MATIDYGRLLGPRGFARPVAIKRLHPQYAKDPDFVSMFIDEARMSARLHHANVIPTLDVIEGPGELALVMEYVHGESLATLLELARDRGELVPVRIAVTLLSAVLHGLHSAHEATREQGEPLRIVHRDVSPQNVLIGQDGIPRLLDFGVAKAVGRLRSTPSGEIKGKLWYISPEQLRGGDVDRRADVYGASSVLWEVLTGRRLFDGPNESMIVHAVLNQVVAAPSSENPEVPPGLDRIVQRGLSRPAEERFATAREMALALERDVGVVTQSEVSDWLQALAGEHLAARARMLQAMQENAERTRAAAAERAPGGVQGTRRLELQDELALAPNADLAFPGTERAVLRRGRGFAAIAAAAFVIMVLAAIWGTTRQKQAFEPRANVPVGQPLPAPTPAPAVPEALAIEAASAPRPALPLAVVANPAQAEQVPSSTSTRKAVHKRPRPAARSPKASESVPAAGAGERARNCVPPYVIDRVGVRHPKPECL